MINQQAVVDQIVQNLAFDVEAIPKEDLIQTTSISQSTPLNVKIKVRKKDEIHNMQHDIATADNTPRTKQKIRLVNSDRTIMNFDVFMEAEFEKKPAKKLRKHIFDMLRPGICLGAVDDNEYPYMPSSSYSAKITEPSVVNKSDGTLKQTFTLTKNVYSVSTQPEGQKWLFGKCKPGGCLDPPFGEDKYSYKPSKRGPERKKEALLEEEDAGTAVDSNKKPLDPPFGEDKYSYKPSTRSGPEREKEALLEAEDVGTAVDSNKKPLDPPFGEDKYSYKPSTRSGPEREKEALLEAEDVGTAVDSNKKPLDLPFGEDKYSYKPSKRSGPERKNEALLEAEDAETAVDSNKKPFDPPFGEDKYSYKPSTRSGPEREKEVVGTAVDSNKKPLDPPFGEDKYSYKPSTRSGPEREKEALLEAEDVGTAVDRNKKPITLHDEETQSNGRHSSVFDSGLFKKKRKSSDKSTSTKIPDKTDSIVDIYQKESVTNSGSTHSNPIITYPPKIKTDPRTSDDKTTRSRGPSENKSRKSFNDHSEPYFVPPKGVQRVKEKEKLNLNDQAKHRSSDVADVRHSLKESFKMPVPIPVPIPTISSKRTPEVFATSDDILKKDSIPDHKLQNKELLNQEQQDQIPQDTINLKDTETPPLLLRTKSESEDTDDKLVKSSKKETSIPSNIKQTNASNEIDDQNLNEIKLEPLEAKENIKEETAQPSKQKNTEYFEIPILVPLPFNFSDSHRTDAADTPFGGSKDMQQSIDPRLGENESVGKTTLNLEYSNIEGDAIPEIYLRTRGGFTEQESNTEIPVTLDLTMDKDIERDSNGERSPDRMKNPEKQKVIRDNATMPTKYTQEDVNPDLESRFGGEEMTDGIKKLAEQKDTQEDIKRVPKEDTITDGTEIPAKQDDIKDKMTTSAIYTSEKDRIRDFEEKKIIDGIGKPEQQKYIKDKATIPTKYAGNSSDVHGKDKSRLSLPSEPEYETDTKEDIKRVSKADTITDGMKIPAKQDDIKDKITTSAIYTTEEDRIRDSEGEKIIDGIGKPEQQKYIKDKATIPTKYAGNSSDVHGKDINRLSLPSEPEYETDTQEDIKRVSKKDTITDGIEIQAKQGDIKDKITTSAKYTTEEDRIRDSEGEKIIDGIGKPEQQKYIKDKATIPTKYAGNSSDVHGKDKSRLSLPSEPKYETDTQEDIKRVSKKDTITDGIEIQAKQGVIKDKITTSAIYTTEEDRIRDSEEEKIIDAIGKPEQQKYIKDKATIPSKYAGNSSDVHGKDKSRLSLPSEPEYETDTQEDIKRDFEGFKKPEEQQEDIKAITEKDIKRVSKEDTITDGIEIQAKQGDIKDKITTSAIYTTEEDRIRHSEGGKIIDRIGKPEQQKYIKDKATIPTKYAENSSDVHGKDKSRLSLPSEPEYETDTKEDIKRVSKEDTITYGMKIPAKQDDIKDKITTSAIYTTEEDRVRDSEGEKIIDGIGKPEQQKYIKDKATIPTKYAGGSSDVHGKDENRSSLPSEPEYKTYTGNYDMSKPHRNKEYETTKTNKDDNIDSHTGGQKRYTSEGAMDIIAAPVIIDNNTELSSMFEPVKDDYSETNLSNGVPEKIVSRFKKFDDVNNDLETTESQALIGTRTAVYHSDGFVPSTSTKKHSKRTPSYDKQVILPKDTVLTSIQSTSTLKSAMKHDTISIDLGFHCYLNNNNERIVQTFDSANAPKRLPNDSVTVIKSQIRLSSNEIRIAVDSEHDMSIEIKKANTNQRVSISESRLVNVIGTGKTKKQTSPEQYRDVETRSFEPKAEGTMDNTYGSEASADRLLDYYEKELVPLQLTIKNLRDEIDFLSTQQTMFRDKLYCPNKSKPPRLVHSNKKCFGCAKK